MRRNRFCRVCKRPITAKTSWCLRTVAGEIGAVHQPCHEPPKDEKAPVK